MVKKILLIQPVPTPFVIKTLREEKCEIVLATNKKSLNIDVDKILYVNIFNVAELISLILDENKIKKIDCVLPTWEGTIDKCSLISTILGLPTNEYKSILLSRDKLLSFYALKTNNVPTSKSFVIDNFNDKGEKLVKKVGFPAVIKLRTSTNSQGVIRVNSLEEYIIEKGKLRNLLENNGLENRLSPLYNRKFSIVVQEYLDGREVNIDILYKNERYLCMGVFEKDAMLGPYFPEKMSVYPTSFSKEEEEEMIELAIQGIKALEAKIGMAHVEIRYTSTGPKIIEIALRPGGAYTTLAINELSKVNVYKELIKVLTIDDYFPIKKQSVGSCLYAGILIEEQGILESIEGTEHLINMPGLIEYSQIKNIGDSVSLPPETSDMHILHYLLWSKNREGSLKKYNLLNSKIKVSIKNKQAKLLMIDFPRSKYSKQKCINEAIENNIKLYILTEKKNSDLDSNPNIQMIYMKNPDLKCIIDFIKENSIDNVFSLTEFGLEFASSIRESLMFKGDYRKQNINTRNKLRTRQILDTNKIRNIKYKECLLNDLVNVYENEMPEKCIIKPLKLTGSVGVFSVLNKEDIEVFLQKIAKHNLLSQEKSYLIEEFIEGEEVSVEGIVIDGVFNCFAITQKYTTGEPYFSEIGHRLPMNISEKLKSEIIEYSNSCIKALEIFNSPLHIELRLSVRGPILIEMHTRYGGDNITQLLSLSLELDIYNIYYQSLLGNEYYISPKNKGINQIKFFISKSGILNNVNIDYDYLSREEVVDYNFDYNQGDLVVAYPHMFLKHGYVIFHGTNHRDLNQVAMELDKKILFQVSEEINYE